MHNVHILSTILIVSIITPSNIIINIIYSWHYAHISQNYIQPGSSKKKTALFKSTCYHRWYVHHTLFIYLFIFTSLLLTCVDEHVTTSHQQESHYQISHQFAFYLN